MEREISKCDLFQSGAGLTKPDRCGRKSCCFYFPLIAQWAAYTAWRQCWAWRFTAEVRWRTDGCTVDMQGVWEWGRRLDCGENLLSCRAPLVAWMRTYELLMAFSSEVVIACGTFISTGRRASEQSRGGDTGLFSWFVSKKKQESALNTVFAVCCCLMLSMWMHVLLVSFIKLFKSGGSWSWSHLQIIGWFTGAAWSPSRRLKTHLIHRLTAAQPKLL